MSEVVLKDSIPKYGEFADGKLWFSRKGSILTLGLTSSAVEDLGEITSIEFPDDGDAFDNGDVVVTVDGNSGNMEVITPASGVISEINAGAKEDSNVVAEDPLEEGWLVKIEIEDTSDLKEYAVILG